MSVKWLWYGPYCLLSIHFDMWLRIPAFWSNSQYVVNVSWQTIRVTHIVLFDMILDVEWTSHTYLFMCTWSFGSVLCLCLVSRWWSGIAISMWRKSIGNWTKRFAAWIHGNRNSSLLSLCRKACFVTVYLFNNIIISFNVQVN